MECFQVALSVVQVLLWTGVVAVPKEPHLHSASHLQGFKGFTQKLLSERLIA